MSSLWCLVCLCLVGCAWAARGDSPVIREPDSIDFSMAYDLNPDVTKYHNYGRRVDKRGYVYSSDNFAFLPRKKNAVLPKPVTGIEDYGSAVSSTKIMRAARLSRPDALTEYDVYFVCAGGSQEAYVYSGYEMVTETKTLVDPNDPTQTIEQDMVVGTREIDIPTSFQKISKPQTPPNPSADFCRHIEGGSFVGNAAMEACMITELFITAYSSSGVGYVSRYELRFQENPEEMGQFLWMENIPGPTSVKGFGHKVASKGNWLVVSSVMDGVVVVYKRVITGCGSTFEEYQELKGLPTSYGEDISITYKDRLWVGSWKEDKVYIYSMDTMNAKWPVLQVLQGTQGHKFGYSLVGMGDTYGFVGAPGANNGGGMTFFFKADCSDPNRALIQADQIAFNDSQHYGYETGIDGCRTALLGGGDGEAVYRWNADIAAYFDEYCTCRLAKAEREYAQHYLHHDDLNVDSCKVQTSHEMWECQMGGAPYLCNYQPQHGWVFVKPLEKVTEVPSYKCVPPLGQFVRRKWMYNCLHDVVECPKA